MTRHINNAFLEETRPMMYKMMKWWGGKPHNIWSKYIGTYTKKGEVVLDPFCGRGVGVIESVIGGRRAIGIDLNPIAIFQTKMISKHLDVRKFMAEWKKMKTDLNRIESQSDFFKTKCKKCQRDTRMVTVNRKDDVPYTMFYKCTCEPGYQEKPLDKNDEDAIGRSNAHDTRHPYPKQRFPNTKAFDLARRNYGDTYDKLFSKRNIFALSAIFDRVNKVADDDLRDFFRFAFISMVHLASRIPSVRVTRVGSGSWGRPAYIKLQKRMEMNPFVLYERAIEGNQGIIKGKTNSNGRIGKKAKFAKSVADLDSGCNLLLLQKNTLEMSDVVADASVDFVITDPPYGGLIPYFDLSYLWSSWLSLVDNGFLMPFDDEITIDECKKMGFEEYHRRLKIAFGHVFRILKEDKYMVVTFHNDQPRIFNSMLRACQDNGFVLEKILFQMNRRAGETGAASPWGTAVSDFYIRFRKPKRDETGPLTDFIETRFERIVESVAKETLSQRGEPAEIAAMIPRIYKEMGQSGMRVHFSSDDQISTILKKNKNFVSVGNNLWWLADSVIRESRLHIPLSDRVEESVLGVLRKNYKSRYDQILQSIFEQFPNSLTPNTENIKDYLSEYGEKTSDGMWRLKLGMKEEEMTSRHTEIEVMLAKLGKKFGYGVWSPDKSKDKRMERLCGNFELDGHPNSERVRLIDVLWLRGGAIKYAFEVENSTGITSALERGSNIESEDAKKIIVLPDERMKFFRRKMQEPLFRDYFEKDAWQVVLYSQLESFANAGSCDEESFALLPNDSK